ncbi:MAG: sensor protein [Acidobacteriaceae bacterium]|jgi:CheY-like chemotaxis protein|nr:sensor protein [Acidobacteriaceae bacterium]
MNDRSVVLLVNDNPRPQRLLTSILEDRGFEVKTADGALEALELIRGNSFALALLDYQMPEMTSAQLAQEIRVMDPALPIILLSGLTFLPAGELIYVDAHIGHGSTIEDLMEMMRALMERESTLIGAPESVRNKAATVSPGAR